MIGIGIDTGGTYTDAVIYDFEKREVLAKGKALTTKESLEVGIIRAMDSLPEVLLHEAKILSLSTTLATNACVENKGGRAKLILLGTTDHILEWIDAKNRYGLSSEDVLCVDSPSINDKKIIGVPDWYEAVLGKEAWLADAQALAVAEVPAMRNGAMCEKYTKENLTKKYPVPFVMANELAAGLNVMERGATALLNARLLPVIEEFMAAVKKALEQRKLNITEMIVRSDGSLMSENIALSYPVQTILSGPASSVIGARNLAECEDCLIVDMGGTTTDISVVKAGVPEMSDRIAIGGYKTQIRGVYIETFGLGGDSRISVENGHFTLGNRRVQPLCVAASQYPEILEHLQELVDSKRTHTLPLHEVLYLVKEPKNSSLYTAKENKLIEKLKDHPVVIGSNELDIYSLKTERLEREGIIMRCGLTPTDIMHIRGDFTKYNQKASVLGAKYIMQNLPDQDPKDLDGFCEQVYDFVCRKMYENIVKLLLENTYPQIFSKGVDNQIMELIRKSWDDRNAKSYFGLHFSTQAALIGIGAPTHIFLPRVAEALGVPCVIPQHAEVANAVGAITADISSICKIRIAPDYSQGGIDGYYAYLPDGSVKFEELEDAVALAREKAEAQAIADAKKRGAMGQLTVQVKVDSQNGYANSGSAVELDTFVIAVARGRIYQETDG